MNAFMGYAEHQQDLEEAVEILVEGYFNGETEIGIQFETEVSEADKQWVMEEVKRRLRAYDY